MPAVLILTGITILLLATIWLMEHASHHGVSGWRLLIPFINGEYIREYWQKVRWVALVRVLGVVLIVLGIGVLIARQPAILTQPSVLWGGNTSRLAEGSTQDSVNRFIKIRHQALLAMQQNKSGKLAGEIHGQPFAYQRVQLTDGVLSARQGNDFLPDLEVRVLIHLNPRGMKQQRSFYVSPGDKQAPRIYLAWKDAKGQLQTRIIQQGYSLELTLSPLDAYRLNGFMQLILPGKSHSYLSGRFIAVTSDLRFTDDGNVNIAYNDPDTLKYVAEQYLKTRLTDPGIRHIRFEKVTINVGADSGYVDAVVLRNNYQLEEHQMQLKRHDFGWRVAHNGHKRIVLRTAQAAAAMREATQEKSEVHTNITVADLLGYIGQTVTLTQVDGRTDNGKITGMGRKGLELLVKVQAGSVKYYIQPDKISRLVLSSGEVLLLPAGQKAAAEKPALEQAAGDTAIAETTASNDGATASPSAEKTADIPADTAETATEQAAVVTASSTDQPNAVNASTVPESLLQYKPLLGKQVTITGTSGQQRSGFLTGVHAEQLALKVSLGAGSVHYYYKPGEVASVTPLKN